MNSILLFIKKNLMILLFLFLGILYFLLSFFNYLSIPCPIYYIFHIWCPGCGVTRMIHSMFQFNFYQAFRYNSFLFLSFPFFIFFLIDTMICNYQEKMPLCYRIPRWVYYSYMILLLLFMILRNLFGIFAPIGL